MAVKWIYFLVLLLGGGVSGECVCVSVNLKRVLFG